MNAQRNKLLRGLLAASAGLLVETPAFAAPLVPIAVDQCTDGTVASGTTLRMAIAQAAQAVDAQIVIQCKGRIDLNSSLQVVAPARQLDIVGPSTSPSDLVISAGGANFAVLESNAQNSLSLSGVTITGSLGSPQACLVAHSGSLVLTNSEVSGCASSVSDSTVTAKAAGIAVEAGQLSLIQSVVSGNTLTAKGNGRGAGIYASGAVMIDHSAVRDNVLNAGNYADGGGIYAMGGFSASFSTVSGNVVQSATTFANGGGVFASGTVAIDHSTLSGNVADLNSAAQFGRSGGPSTPSVAMLNSTVASNAARYEQTMQVNAPLSVEFTTIARNRVAFLDSGAAGLNSSLPIVSIGSVFAENTAADGTEDDVRSSAPGAPFGAGSNSNLVGASSQQQQLPPDTLTGCAALGPLQNNGGPTQTMIPLPKSRARGAFFGATLPSANDQRGLPRRVAASDIGAVQVQAGEVTDSIFVAAFEGLCG